MQVSTLSQDISWGGGVAGNSEATYRELGENWALGLKVFGILPLGQMMRACPVTVSELKSDGARSGPAEDV